MDSQTDPKKITDFLYGSEIQNYLETTERLFLRTISEKFVETENQNKITETEIQELKRLYKKYKRFVND
ncbi:MAG: hypothetical protein GWN01_15225 [Nitrosopumilaceae archaeon]|nr:hypothetical protein [Nitrosopumilaceae archaeon]NIU02195.1 hypothetical protein [Nitrosopumilaceae archaeon]NIU88667.1 hypothetical protein [Nitrosopumilaceae archaeon]NIV66817.1 hypothetical protein [Nitrosopumilaceae archaeon]NIX62796.1 hypothetical protein [Nitrosopumilaceae archaeon]